MYFCNDVDLLPWEPALFFESTFAHQRLVHDAPGTLTGNALVMSSAVLGPIAPGMVAAVTLADDSLTQLLEITAVADTTHATVSSLRGRNDEGLIPPLTGGSVKVTITSFRPQVAAVGDELLALVGIASDRETDPTPGATNLAGFRTAATFATLAALFRTLAATTNATTLTLSKLNFYDRLASGTRHAISVSIDTNNDSLSDSVRRADTLSLQRT